MLKCPVCRTQPLPQQAATCPVCGWPLKTDAIAQIGPVKIKHHLAQDGLAKLESWAAHMWTTIQQQKQRIAQLQTQLRRLPPSEGSSPESQMTLPAELTQLLDQRDPKTVSVELLQAIIVQWTHCEQERSRLQFQVSQLRAQWQQAQIDPDLAWREELQAQRDTIAQLKDAIVSLQAHLQVSDQERFP